MLPICWSRRNPIRKWWTGTSGFLTKKSPRRTTSHSGNESSIDHCLPGLGRQWSLNKGGASYGKRIRAPYGGYLQAVPRCPSPQQRPTPHPQGYGACADGRKRCGQIDADEMFDRHLCARLGHYNLQRGTTACNQYSLCPIQGYFDDSPGTEPDSPDECR